MEMTTAAEGNCNQASASKMKRAPAACDRLLRVDSRLKDVNLRLSKHLNLMGASPPPSDTPLEKESEQPTPVGLVFFLEGIANKLQRHCDALDRALHALETTF